MSIQHTKRIKVNRMLYSRTIKDKQHGDFGRKVEEFVPWVQIKGQWLAKAGFNIDTSITIEISDGKLVLIAE